MTNQRTAYSSDVSNEEWHFCVPYLTLIKEDAPQRGMSQIRRANLEVKGCGLAGMVLSFQQPVCLSPITSSEAFLFTR